MGLIFDKLNSRSSTPQSTGGGRIFSHLLSQKKKKPELTEAQRIAASALPQIVSQIAGAANYMGKSVSSTLTEIAANQELKSATREYLDKDLGMGVKEGYRESIIDKLVKKMPEADKNDIAKAVYSNMPDVTSSTRKIVESQRIVEQARQDITKKQPFQIRRMKEDLKKKLPKEVYIQVADRIDSEWMKPGWMEEYIQTMKKPTGGIEMLGEFAKGLASVPVKTAKTITQDLPAWALEKVTGKKYNTKDLITPQLQAPKEGFGKYVYGAGKAVGGVGQMIGLAGAGNAIGLAASGLPSVTKTLPTIGKYAPKVGGVLGFTTHGQTQMENASINQRLEQARNDILIGTGFEIVGSLGKYGFDKFSQYSKGQNTKQLKNLLDQNSRSILGVSENASKKEIKSTYKELTKTYHPDVGVIPNNSIFNKITLANKNLQGDIKSRDAIEKTLYDISKISGEAGAVKPAAVPFGGLLEEKPYDSSVLQIKNTKSNALDFKTISKAAYKGSASLNEIPKTKKSFIKGTAVQAKASGQSFDDWVKGQTLVYHGTSAKLKQFNNKQGAFFTDDMMNAEGYAGGENVYEGYLDFKKPFVIDAKGRLYNDLKTEYGKSTQEIVDKIDQKKYDGVIFKNIKDSWVDDVDTQYPITIYYAFKPRDTFKNVDTLKAEWDAKKSVQSKPKSSIKQDLQNKLDKELKVNAGRPNTQKQIEDLLNNNEVDKAQRIVTAMKDTDPYKKPMQNLIKEVELVNDKKIESLINEGKIEEANKIVSNLPDNSPYKESSFKSIQEVDVPRSQLPVGEGKEKLSRLEARMTNILSKITPEDKERLGLSTFNEMNKNKTIKKSIKYTIEKPDEAIQVLRGEIEAPKGLLRNSIYIAMVNIARGELELARKLASLESTRYGQELSILTELDKDSPVSVLAKINNEYIEVYEKRTSKKAMIEVRKNAKRYKEEIKSVTESIKKDEWEDFLKELTC